MIRNESGPRRRPSHALLRPSAAESFPVGDRGAGTS